jgi:hypothetical protein
MCEEYPGEQVRKGESLRSRGPRAGGGTEASSAESDV